jgi:KRAB domain-containing zinc finger protein
MDLLLFFQSVKSVDNEDVQEDRPDVELRDPKEKTQIHYTCKICAKVYSRMSSLYVHRKIHDGIVHECDLCGKKFSTEKYLQAHLLRKIHLGAQIKQKRVKREHQCPQCDKTFTSKASYKEHIRFMHKKKEVQRRENVCSQCDITFKHRSSYDRHMRFQHHGKGFQCTVCGKVYPDSFTLNRHFGTHFQVKKECDLCKRRFYKLSYHKKKCNSKCIE